MHAGPAVAAGIVVAAYLCGAIPFGLLVGLTRGVDVRTRGSNNIGATNVGRVLGWPWGLLAFTLDLLKGFAPVWLAGRYLAAQAGHGPLSAGDFLAWMAVAFAAILGHVFPVYLRFKGGKGVATSLGVLLGIWPYFTLPGLVAFVFWIVVTGLTRYVSVGSIVAAGSFPFLFAAAVHWARGRWGSADQLWPMYLFSIVLAALVIYRHRSNLKRLLAGTESRIGASRPPSG
ncbi:MAG TPA: glycerol-3-phosphate 1-O-acyltransferase PlsY [Phycisphaerae bacterium]|nr:glycerol-3-phosphate 1-O-acyltransferase PlsY [Phycisphaerae bacterium]